jgi:hypothetical protein
MTRAQLDAAERSVCWIAWPERRVYGPGLTAEEAASKHNAFLRSGASCAGSGAYHRVRVAPESLPADPDWIEAYSSLRAGVDPWSY